MSFFISVYDGVAARKYALSVLSIATEHSSYADKFGVPPCSALYDPRLKDVTVCVSGSVMLMSLHHYQEWHHQQ